MSGERRDGGVSDARQSAQPRGISFQCFTDFRDCCFVCLYREICRTALITLGALRLATVRTNGRREHVSGTVMAIRNHGDSPSSISRTNTTTTHLGKARVSSLRDCSHPPFEWCRRRGLKEDSKTSTGGCRSRLVFLKAISIGWFSRQGTRVCLYAPRKYRTVRVMCIHEQECNERLGMN